MKLIEQMEGTSPGERKQTPALSFLENQYLNFAGKKLQAGTVADHNLQAGSTIHMVQRFQGGM
jgi:hypothetical protein